MKRLNCLTQKTNKMKSVLITVCCLLPFAGFTQSQNKTIQEGNEKYKQQDYAGAQQSYTSALEQDPENEAATYNLGNAMYQQQSFDDAIAAYKKAAETATDPKLKANAYHNLGNALLEQKKYQESINAYKKALQSNPDDADTKYNLAYAQTKLKQQQQQNQNKQDQNKQDQNKQDQNKNQQQQQQDQNKQDQQKQQQSGEPKQYTKEELDRILQALNADDKSVQEAVNKQKVQAAGSGTDLDW